MPLESKGNVSIGGYYKATGKARDIGTQDGAQLLGPSALKKKIAITNIPSKILPPQDLTPFLVETWISEVELTLWSERPESHSQKGAEEGQVLIYKLTWRWSGSHWFREEELPGEPQPSATLPLLIYPWSLSR